MTAATSRPAISTLLLSSALAACGGGGGSAAPQSPTPPAPVAVVASITPATAILDRPTDFEVSGTDLNDGLRFQLDGCDGAIEAAGGSKTRRVFTCTPTGTTGSHALQLYASAGASTSLATRAVDYLTPVAKVGEINGKLAVLKTDGTLWMWAKAPAAGTAITRTQLAAQVTDIEVGNHYGLAISADGGLWAWGMSNDGAFADSGVTSSATPVQIGRDFIKVAVKGSHTTGGERVAALKRDGTLWAWGSRSSPVPNSVEMQLTPHRFGAGFSDLAYGSAGASGALRGDGSLWSWSENLSATPFVPQQTGYDFRSVATAYDATFGIKRNGELWAWGRNAPHRALAGGDDVPLLLGQDYVAVSAGVDYIMALKADGTLWAHGSNSEGQFGNGTTIGGGPVQVAAGIRNVWAGDSCTIVEKRDGTLWSTWRCSLGAASDIPAYGFRQLPQF